MEGNCAVRVAHYMEFCCINSISIVGKKNRNSKENEISQQISGKISEINKIALKVFQKHLSFGVDFKHKWCEKLGCNHY